MAKATRKRRPRGNAASPRPDDEPDPVADGAARAYRLRQASVAAILDQVFGPFGASDPKLWERRAYLLLVGSVYERLATDAAVETDELVKLARVLAESRRSRTRDAPVADTGPAGCTRGDNGRLPDRFAEMVRDLYGTRVDANRSADETSRRESDGVGG